MKNKFKDFWKTSLNTMIDEESAGESKYRDLAETFDEMADDEADHKENLEEMKTKGIIEDANKAVDEQIEKPEGSVHSEKWDKCVADVKKDNPEANAYAVCTSQLGEASFKSFDTMNKSQLDIVKSEVENILKFGIENAGPIPNSKLSRQDLEGTTTKASLTSSDEAEAYRDAVRMLKRGMSPADIAHTIASDYGCNYNTARQIVDAAEYNTKSMTKGEDKAYIIEIEYKKTADSIWSKVQYTVKARSDDEARNMACQMFEDEYNSITTPEGQINPLPYNQKYQIRSEGVNIKKSSNNSALISELEDAIKDAKNLQRHHEKEGYRFGYNEQQKRIDALTARIKDLKNTKKSTDLEELADKAEDVTSTEEKYDLVDKIKATQKKKQREEITARKTFKDYWRDQTIGKSLESDIKMWERKIDDIRDRIQHEPDSKMRAEWKQHIKDYADRIADIKDQIKRDKGDK